MLNGRCSCSGELCADLTAREVGRPWPRECSSQYCRDLIRSISFVYLLLFSTCKQVSCASECVVKVGLVYIIAKTLVWIKFGLAQFPFSGNKGACQWGVGSGEFRITLTFVLNVIDHPFSWMEPPFRHNYNWVDILDCVVGTCVLYYFLNIVPTPY